MFNSTKILKDLKLLLAVIAATSLILAAATANAWAATGSLSTDKDSYEAGEPVMVTAACSNNTANDAWVGLYKPGDTPGPSCYSFYWYYLNDNGTSNDGKAVNILDKEGNPRSYPEGDNNYKLVLFGDSGYNNIVATKYITIDNGGSQADITGSITLENAQNDYVLETDALMVKATCSNTDPEGAWVGLYKKGDNPGATGDKSFYYYYLNTSSINRNGVAVNLFDFRCVNEYGNEVRASELKTGDYKIILFGTGGYSPVLDQKDIHITVSSETPPEEITGTMTTDKTSYTIIDPIMVTAESNGSDAWVGLYGANESPNGGPMSYCWYWVADHNGQAFDLKSGTNNRPVEAGNYKVILFGDSGFTNVLKTINITITDDVDYEGSLATEGGKTEFVYGEEPINVIATCNNTSGSQAWVGLYPKNTNPGPGTTSIYWYYLNEAGVSRNGVPFDILQGTFNGGALGADQYKLVLFGDSGYDYILDTLEIRIIKHTSDMVIVKDATCYEEGIAKVQYSGSDKWYTEPIPVKEHTWSEWTYDAEHHKHSDKDNGYYGEETGNCEFEEEVITPATESEHGLSRFTCKCCGGSYEAETTYVKPTVPDEPVTPPATAEPEAGLSASSYTYDGNTHKPSVKVTAGDKTLTEGTDYNVTYSSGCKNVGKYTVTVTFKGEYDGKVIKQTFRINPKKTGFTSKTKAGKKKITAKWKKVSNQATGYEIQYSTNSDFSGKKKITIKSYKTTYKVIKSLKSKKTYYLRIRTYKTVDGTKYYSDWSATKTIKVK